MTEIFLEGLEFYAHHGYYAEEQQLGNRFQVDIRLQAEVPEAGLEDDLSRTIDYVQVYNLIRAEMQKRFKLLEALGQRIIDQLRLAFPSIQTLEVRISKFNPPISGLCQRVSVTQRWQATD
jgi:dihydroneopterin aldolase